MSTILLKINHEGALRRVTCERGTSCAELRGTIHSMFHGIGAGFGITYEDDEGDTITVSSDAELGEAFTIFESQGWKSLRLNITPGAGAEAVPPQVLSAPPAPASAADPARAPAPPPAASLSGLAQLLPALLARGGTPMMEQLGPLLAPIVTQVQEQINNAHEQVAAAAAAAAGAAAGAATPAPPASPPPPPPPSFQPEVHANILCDGCTDGEGHDARNATATANGTVLPDGTIVGVRYKSAVVKDFDLCATCEDGGAFEATHEPFLKITRPSMAPSAIVAVINDGAPGGDACHQASAGAGAALDEIHWGVTCDVSGMCPIVGKRFQKRGEDYDLCEAEFSKLSADEQALYDCIEAPARGPRGRHWGGWYGGGHGKGKGKGKGKGGCHGKGKGKRGGWGRRCFATADGEPIHWGVECDVSGMCPIVGKRFQKRGENYDLCEAEFSKLSADEQALYDCIEAPAHGPRGGGGSGWRGGGGGKGRGGNRGGGCGRGWRMRAEVEAEEDQQLRLAMQMSAQAHGAPKPASPVGGGGAAAAANTAATTVAPTATSATVHTVNANLANLTASGWQSVPAELQQQQAPPQPPQRLLARFVSDVTYEDGRTVSCGTVFRKVWRMRNEGTTAWPEGTRLQPVGGDDLDSAHDGERGVAVASAAPGTEVDVAVDLSAPARPGRYVQYWRLSHAPHAHSRFGHRVWVDVTAEQQENTGQEQAPEQNASAFQDAVDAAAAEAIVAKAEGDNVDDLVAAACARSLLEVQEQEPAIAPAATAAPAPAPALAMTVSAQIAQQVLAQMSQDGVAASSPAMSAAPSEPIAPVAPEPTAPAVPEPALAPSPANLSESGWQQCPGVEQSAEAAPAASAALAAMPEPASPVGAAAAAAAPGAEVDLTASGWQQPTAAALSEGDGSSDDLTRSGSWTSISASMIQQQQAQAQAAQDAQAARQQAQLAEQAAAQLEEQLAAKHAQEARELATKQQQQAAAQAAELAQRQAAELAAQQAAQAQMSPEEQFELALRLSVESAEADAARRTSDE